MRAQFVSGPSLALFTLCWLGSLQGYDVPLYINIGGPQVVDSLGRTWLGDGTDASDPLGIRSNDLGGTNVIAAWCNPSAAALTALGFDPANANDNQIFRDMRWDNGGDAFPYRFAIPLTDSGFYDVTLYFCESCCPNRHFKVLTAGETAFPDVSTASYSGGANNYPGSHTAQNVYVGASKDLIIELLPCPNPECAGGTDGNAVLSALAVTASAGDPCASGESNCTFNLACTTSNETLSSADITLTWDGPACIDVVGFDVYQDGSLIQSLPPTAGSFTVPQGNRSSVYRVATNNAAGEPACAELSCTVTNSKSAFETPLQINMGGPQLVDSHGRTWLGDSASAGDPLNIRPDDAGGSNFIPNWCNPNPAALETLGFDPANANDVAIFQSMRWDNAADGSPFTLNLLLDPGFYDVTLYFCEAGGPNRHFKVQMQGTTVFPDVSSATYAGGAAHTPGQMTAEDVYVGDSGILEIRLLPCPNPECPGGTDGNPVLSGVAISASAGDPCNEGKLVCPFNFRCASSDEESDSALVSGSWEGPACFTPLGYDVYQDGVLIETLPADASGFSALQTTRSGSYRVVVKVPDGAPACPDLSCAITNPKFTVPTPLYVNMGGVQVVDSYGRTWLGDGTGADPLSIRPNDAGGANVIAAGGWCNPAVATFNPGLAAAGFNPGTQDAVIFQTIRWDTGGDVAPYDIQVPVGQGSYNVRLYFCEACCLNRHAKVAIEGVTVLPDVSPGSYGGGTTHTPGLHEVRDVIVGADNLLDIRLLGCVAPECPGGGDGNAILSALAILKTSDDECDLFPAFRKCPQGLTCTLEAGTGAVLGTFEGPTCIAVESYEVWKNGALLTTLPPNETSFTDTLSTRAGFYEVRPILPEGQAPCPTLTCTVARDDVPFATPLRINMGGNSLYDSLGRVWIGDGTGAGDFLSIRPDDAGGTNTIVAWCAGTSQAMADSLQALGLDPFNANDQAIFNTIRYDNGDDDGDGLVGQRLDTNGGDTDYVLQIPVADATYQVNLYYTECCCPNRHFYVEINGRPVDEDVSAADYSLSGRLGRTGRLSYNGIRAGGGRINIALRPCPDPDCPGGTDGNAILDAIEVLPNNTELLACPNDLVLVLNGDGTVTGTWIAPLGITVSGYTLFLNGAKVADIAGSASSFTYDPGCVRLQEYELVPSGAEVDGLCPDLRMANSLVNPDCAFELPLRINLGGPTLVDSLGRTWLGDRRPGAPEIDDPLEIRPNDSGGFHSIIDWCSPAADRVSALGFDPSNAADRSLLSTIRWDEGADAFPYQLLIPLDEGTYSVDLYFNECCCPNRHFSAAINGNVVDADISYNDYDPASPALGDPGRLSFAGILVETAMEIVLLPCLDPTCAGGGDPNPIMNALEATRTGNLPNTRPTARIVPSATEVELRGGAATVTLDGSSSDDGDGGAQGLTYRWTQISGPVAAEVPNPDAAIAPVNFSAEGEYVFELAVDDGQAVVSSDTEQVTITVKPTSGPRFVRADANSDGQIDISDGAKVLNYLFLGGEDPECLDASDANDDSIVNIADPSFIFNWLFLGGRSPPPPTPSASGQYPPSECDLDPTDDDLGCAEVAAKCQ
jgi:hypothetical protein